MGKVSLKAYALKHKLSLFNVIKMTKTGQVPTQVVLENGKEVVYILIEEEVEKNVIQKIQSVKDKEPYSMRKENERLKKEVEKLKKEIILLRNRET